jgi:hypothetical protein
MQMSRQSVLASVTWAVAALLCGVATPATGENVDAAVRLEQIRCNKTTESGEDEIYLLVEGITDKREAFGKRIPEEGHWSLNDNGDAREKLDVALWKGSLGPGQSVDLVLMILEEDFERNPAAEKQIQESLRKAFAAGGHRSHARAIGTTGEDGDTWATLIPVLVELIKAGFDAIRHNTDDIPGVILVRVWNDAGSIKSDYRALARARVIDGDRTSSRIELNGDGSRYELKLRVNQ